MVHIRGSLNKKEGLGKGTVVSVLFYCDAGSVVSRLINLKVAERKIGLFSHLPNAPSVSHLLYANDVVVLANASKGSIRSLLLTIKFYEKWSGRLVNYNTSAIFFSKILPVSQS